MKEFVFQSPSLDLGCGDGTFSFLRANGEFDELYDVFMDVDNLDKFYENCDVYDSFHNITDIKIKKYADYKIDVGLDHKQNLMNKAEKLSLYNEFILANANEKLPFADESFASIFSNIIYWLDDPENTFKEIYRILKRGGKCCVMLPNVTFLESSFYYRFCKLGKIKEFEFLRLIDRGRVDGNIKVVKTYDEWKGIIGNSGLKIEACVPHLSKTLIQIWDIGLRPIFPMLKKMTEQLDDETLLNIKSEWVDLFQKIGQPIIENEKMLSQGEEFCFFCFILSKV